jgi:hypothetical protein
MSFTPHESGAILTQAHYHFFQAMLSGWAAGVKAVPIPDRPGWKQIVYEQGDFRIVDRFRVFESGMSVGDTVIFYCGSPVWHMSYGGFYPKEDIDFLKKALMHEYHQRKFTGGRGPDIYPEMLSGKSGRRYENKIASPRDNFISFSGRESITDVVSEMERGYHRYWGMALI